MENFRLYETCCPETPRDRRSSGASSNTSSIIENFPSSSCIRVDYIMNKKINTQVPETDWVHSVAERLGVTASAKNVVS
jgi:hypothetical protein